MAAKKKAVGVVPSPLVLAHAARKAESARIRAMTSAVRTIEIAPQYVGRAIKAIRKIGVLGSAVVNHGTADKPDWRAKFALTAEQKARILSTLRYEIDQLDGRLNPGEGKGKAKAEFTF